MSKVQFNCRNLNELPAIAKNILSESKSTKFAIYGNLGSGKTTLIKAFCKELGISQIIDSPTFTILKEYHEETIVFHFDFYRIKNIDEIYELGYEEYFFSNNFVFIEWPEKIEKLLPDFFSKINIEVINNNSRLFTLYNEYSAQQSAI